MNRTTTITSTFGAVALTLLLAACGSDDGTNPFTAGDNGPGGNSGNSDYCDMVAQSFEGERISEGYSSGQSHSEVMNDQADILREVAAAAPDDSVAADWNDLADALDALADLPEPDDDPSGEQWEQYNREWDLDQLGDRVSEYADECGVDMPDAVGGSQTADEGAQQDLGGEQEPEDGAGQESEQAEQEAEAAGSEEYCALARPFEGDVIAASTFSTSEEASTISDQLHELAVLAPDRTAAEEWRMLAEAVGMLSSQDMSDSLDLDIALFEMSNDDPPAVHSELNHVPGRLTYHLTGACGFRGYNPGGYQAGGEQDERQPTQDTGEEPDTRSAGEYCGLVDELSGMLTSDDGLTDPDVMDDNATAAREVAAAAPDDTSAAGWNAMADVFEAAADITDPDAFQQYIHSEYGPIADRVNENLESECS